MKYSLQTITYKGKTHLYNYGFHTDCGIEIPLQGRHLQTRKHYTRSVINYMQGMSKNTGTGARINGKRQCTRPHILRGLFMKIEYIIK